jgi:hypothetical protein
MAVLTARNAARKIAGAVRQLPASWVATLIEIFLVLDLAGVPSTWSTVAALGSTGTNVRLPPV